MIWRSKFRTGGGGGYLSGIDLGTSLRCSHPLALFVNLFFFQRMLQALKTVRDLNPGTNEDPYGHTSYHGKYWEPNLVEYNKGIAKNQPGKRKAFFNMLAKILLQPGEPLHGEITSYNDKENKTFTVEDYIQKVLKKSADPLAKALSGKKTWAAVSLLSDTIYDQSSLDMVEVNLRNNGVPSKRPHPEVFARCQTFPDHQGDPPFLIPRYRMLMPDAYYSRMRTIFFDPVAFFTHAILARTRTWYFNKWPQAADSFKASRIESPISLLVAADIMKLYTWNGLRVRADPRHLETMSNLSDLINKRDLKDHNTVELVLLVVIGLIQSPDDHLIPQLKKHPETPESFYYYYAYSKETRAVLSQATKFATFDADATTIDVMKYRFCWECDEEGEEEYTFDSIQEVYNAIVFNCKNPYITDGLPKLGEGIPPNFHKVVDEEVGTRGKALSKLFNSVKTDNLKQAQNLTLGVPRIPPKNLIEVENTTEGEEEAVENERVMTVNEMCRAVAEVTDLVMGPAQRTPEDWKKLKEICFNICSGLRLKNCPSVKGLTALLYKDTLLEWVRHEFVESEKEKHPTLHYRCWDKLHLRAKSVVDATFNYHKERDFVQERFKKTVHQELTRTINGPWWAVTRDQHGTADVATLGDQQGTGTIEVTPFEALVAPLLNPTYRGAGLLEEGHALLAEPPGEKSTGLDDDGEEPPGDEGKTPRDEWEMENHVRTTYAPPIDDRVRGVRGKRALCLFSKALESVVDVVLNDMNKIIKEKTGGGQDYMQVPKLENLSGPERSYYSLKGTLIFHFFSFW